MKKLTLLILITIVALTGVLTVSAQEEMPGTGIENGVSVTVYNQGTALIQDRRTFALEEGINVVNFTDVASSIDATSVSVTSITDPDGTYVLEQNYVYDLVDTSALLRRYIDQTIEVTTLSFSGEPEVFTGQLLSGRSNEIILQMDGGEVVVITGTITNIRFPELPDGLITRPTLRWMLASSMSGDQQVELTYLTGGISWTADYIVLLNQDNTALDLNGWITLNNTSGTAYHDAQLKLIAGDVNRLPQPTAQMGYADSDMRMAAAPVEEGVAQREFSEYQLYEVNRAVTIGNNETKQVEFVTSAGVPANQYFVYNSSQPFWGYYNPIADQYYGQSGITDVGIYLEFSTDDDGGVGADLPAGRIRVYQEDIDGAALLIGENRIDHTPMGEEIDIYMGNAFDLVGERTQTDFQLVTRNVLRETYEIKLRNRKDDETVEIRIPENLFRWSNWEILNATHEFTQLNASTIEFRVNVLPGEEKVLMYTVEYSWP
jgi:hypothetical protein